MFTIYKKDTTGKIRYITISNRNDLIFQESGVVGTDNPVVHEKRAKAKNVGKRNETTPTEQAGLEVERFVKDKLDQGYFNTIEEAEQSEEVLPMLAKEFTKEERKVDWKSGWIENPKLDGMRCLAIVKNNKCTIISRRGKVIDTMKHIEDELSQLEDCILDGELYTKESFQTNMSYIKKYQEGLSEQISLWVYDLVSKDEYAERFNKATQLIKDLKNVVGIPHSVVYSKDEMLEKFKQHVTEGYEGLMLKNPKGLYKNNGRSSDLLKHKEFIDIQQKIIDVIPMENRPEFGLFVFDGFKGTPKMTEDQKREILLNKKDYIGMMAEIRFFEYTDDGIPRFPVVVGVREW